jgi:hypothetical protein
VYGLSLEWSRCPDGVELFDYGDRDANKALLAQRSGGPHYRYLSARRWVTRYDLDDLSDPIVLTFVNGQTNDAREEFFSKFGFLHEDQSEISVKEAIHIQKDLRRILYCIGGQDLISAREIVNIRARQLQLIPSLERRRGQTEARLTLRPRTLTGFMVMEIAMIAANGGRLTGCQHCGEWFVTGPLTGRRSHAKFCADRCRVAAMRARNATAVRN